MKRVDYYKLFIRTIYVININFNVEKIHRLINRIMCNKSVTNPPLTINFIASI